MRKQRLTALYKGSVARIAWLDIMVSLGKEMHMKKGDKVYRLHSWDNKGTVSIERCIVESAGKKQIHLRSISTGNCLKHREYTAQINRYYYGTYLVGDVSPAVVQSDALKLAEMVIAEKIAQAQVSIRRNMDCGVPETAYLAHLRKEIDEIHEPRVKWIA
jgi:hypothetical protein